jgi:hypothetical protein
LGAKIIPFGGNVANEFSKLVAMANAVRDNIQGVKPIRDAEGRRHWRAWCTLRYRGWRSVRRLLSQTAIPACVLMPFAPELANAQDVYEPRTTFGETGILEMPSARMAPDGELSMNMSFMENTQRYNLGFQALPWLQATFRYSILQDYEPGFTLNDRSFSLKVRLSQEDNIWPEISLGIRDFIGTGIYAAEYLVATKQLWAFDITGGLGWGRLASNATFPNPLAQIFPSFETRAPSSPQGGTVGFNQFFHGPNMGLFGGIVWHSPIENLDVLAEYSSDRYIQEQKGGELRVRMPVNVGLAYRPFDSVTVTAGWLYGTSYGVVVGFQTDPMHSPSAHFGVEPPPVSQRTDKQQAEAIDVLINRDTETATLGVTRPWVSLGDSSSDEVEMLSNALTNQGGLRDFEITGKSLLINSTLRTFTSQSCEDYARITSVQRLSIDSIAITNLSDPDSRVVTCDVAKENRRDTSSTPPLVRMSQEVAPTSAQLPDSFEYAASLAASETGVLSAGDQPQLQDKIRSEGGAQMLKIDALRLTSSEAWIYYENSAYFFEAEAIGRLVRVLMLYAPPNIEVFHLISIAHGVPLRETRILRSGLERTQFADGAITRLDGGAELQPATALQDRSIEDQLWSSYPHFSWSIAPETREGLFDPQAPLQIQVLAAATGALDIFPGLTLASTLDGNIYNNFMIVPSNSVLPHVRTDAAYYVKKGSNGIADLTLAYRTVIAPNVFAELEGGYLEQMFGGIGGQILWRPDNSRFALGVDVYQVWQRDFNDLFGLRPYQVLTGHFTVYYQTPWQGINVNVHMGRYLAGDYGATFEITRRFDSGIEVGAFATFTNVPFAKYGEGSFDKGIIIRIPLESVLPFYTQSSYATDLHSLNRDGGARLNGDNSLYDETQRTSYGEISAHENQIAWP